MKYFPGGWKITLGIYAVAMVYLISCTSSPLLPAEKEPEGTLLIVAPATSFYSSPPLTPPRPIIYNTLYCRRQ